MTLCVTQSPDNTGRCGVSPLEGVDEDRRAESRGRPSPTYKEIKYGTEIIQYYGTQNGRV